MLPFLKQHFVVCAMFYGIAGGVFGGIKNCELTAKLECMRGLDAHLAAGIKELVQASVPEGPEAGCCMKLPPDLNGQDVSFID